MSQALYCVLYRYDIGVEGVGSRARIPGFQFLLCHPLAGDIIQVT